MWHPGRRVSPVFFTEPTLSWEYLPYHINCREEEALIHYNSGKCPYSLSKLIFLDQVLIKKVRPRWECLRPTRKGYGIEDNGGQKLYFAQQMNGFWSHLCCSKFPINFTVQSEPDRKVVMSFKGSPGILGAGGSLSASLIRSRSTCVPLGDVTQERDFCDPIFSIVDAKGKKRFSIQGPEEGNCWGVAKTAEFNLCQHDQNSVSVVGKLHRNTRVRSFRLEQPAFRKYKWLIEFPRDLDPATKACVIAGAFLLTFYPTCVMSNKNPSDVQKSETATGPTHNSTVSTLELVYRSVEAGTQISNATGLSFGSLTLVSSSCPPGLEALYITDTLYLKAYSGPRVIGHVSKHKRFEILNGEGERIYILSESEKHRSSNDTAEDERRSKYGVRMVVKNHIGDPVFEYYGNAGQYIKTGSTGSRSWGIVSRNWKASKCYCCQGCSCTKAYAFDVVLYNSKFMDPEIDEPKNYTIEGVRKSAMFPSSSTGKLYYGTFECDIKVKAPELKVKRDTANPPRSPEIIDVGKVTSNLHCTKLGMDLPGIVYPKTMNVYHKAVLFGCLLVNVIRT